MYAAACYSEEGHYLTNKLIFYWFVVALSVGLSFVIPVFFFFFFFFFFFKKAMGILQSPPKPLDEIQPNLVPELLT